MMGTVAGRHQDLGLETGDPKQERDDLGFWQTCSNLETEKGTGKVARKPVSGARSVWTRVSKHAGAG